MGNIGRVFYELLGKNVKIQSILQIDTSKKFPEDEHNTIDIVTVDDTKEIILIKLYINKEIDFLSRILYGASKVITEYMIEGGTYHSIKKLYVINILYFDLWNGKDYVYHGLTKFMGLHKNDEILLSRTERKIYKKKITGEVYPEYYIIKLAQFNNTIHNPLDEWIYYFKNSKLKDNFTAKGLSELKEKFDISKASEEEKYRQFIKNTEYEESIISTVKFEGKEDGKVEEKFKIASNMKSLNLSTETIADATGLTRDEIEKLYYRRDL